MPPSIRFSCAACGVRIKASFQLLGQTRQCPQCGYEFVVQLQPPEDSGPLLLQDDLAVPVSRSPWRSPDGSPRDPGLQPISRRTDFSNA